MKTRAKRWELIINIMIGALMVTAIVMLALSAHHILTVRKLQEAVVGHPVQQQTEQAQKSANQDVIQRKIENMTLEQKLGQMVMFGFGGTDGSAAARFIDEYNAGGFILFKANMTSRGQTRHMTNILQQRAKAKNGVGLFISTDQEGGKVTTLRPEICNRGLNNYELGKLGDTRKVMDQAISTAVVLSELGINMNLAPVVDVKTEPQNPAVGKRSYGDDPAVVSRLGCACARALRQQGIIAVVKHFPGHGPTRVDSHTSLPKIGMDWACVENTHLPPFRDAIADGVGVVMTGHIVYTSYDSYPATLSAKLVNGYLREKMGFEGVVISDSLGMRAIRQNFKWQDVVVRSVNAGLDILLVAHDEALMRKTYETLRESVKAGLITTERVDQSVERILRLKLEYGLIESEAADCFTEAVKR